MASTRACSHRHSQLRWNAEPRAGVRVSMRQADQLELDLPDREPGYDPDEVRPACTVQEALGRMLVATGRARAGDVVFFFAHESVGARPDLLKVTVPS